MARVKAHGAPANPEPLDFDLADRVLSMPQGPAREAELKRLVDAGKFGGHRRVYVGKREDRSSVVILSDASARPRMELKVAADGTSSIDFLDERGKVVRSIGPK